MALKGVGMTMVNASPNSGQDSVEIHPLREAWNEFDALAFDEWIINFSELYFRNGLELRQAARIIGVRPAEVQAALNLATLEVESLHVLAGLKPAKTTWFLLAAADNEALIAAASALTTMSPNEPRPSVIVYGVIREVEGPTTLDKVSGLSSSAFTYAYKAAEAYGILTENSRKALKNFASMKKTGRIMTAKQSAYAQDLLRQLVVAGVIGKSDDSSHAQDVEAIISALGAVE